MFRRIIAWTLLLSLTVSCMPIATFADDSSDLMADAYSEQIDNEETEIDFIGDISDGVQVAENEYENDVEDVVDSIIFDDAIENEYDGKKIEFDDFAQEKEKDNSKDENENNPLCITQEPIDVLCNVGETVTLSIAVTSTAQVPLNYHWYCIEGEESYLVDDTNTDTIIPDTTAISNNVYYCEVSVDIDGNTYKIQSDFAQVTVREEQDDAAFFAKEINSHELTQLMFRNGMQTTAAEFQMEPEFNPEVKSYTIIVPDTVNGANGFAVWATLADTASGKITAEYNPIGVAKPIKMPLTSGKAMGQPLGRLFNTNDIVGNTLQIAVDGVPAYEITIVRKATLKALTVEDQNSNEIELTPVFDGNTIEYEGEAPKDAVLKVMPVAVAAGSSLTVNGESVKNGLSEVTPKWDDTQSATIEVEVGGDSAQSSKYTIHLKQAKTLEVPVERQLSQLMFRNGMQTTAAEFQMEPEFNPEVKSYTIIVPDTVNGANGFAVWATLADTASGKITAEYNPIGVAKPIKMPLTSGKAMGQPLGRLFNTNDIVGNTLQIAVDGVPAYEITIVRKATLKGLTVEDQNSNKVELAPVFNGNTFEYKGKASKNAILKVMPVAVATGSSLTVNGENVKNGLSEVTPKWDNTQSATIEVEVGGDTGQSSNYIIVLSQNEPEIDRLEIVSPPTKTEYKEGEAFDDTGLVIKAYYKDGTSKIIENNELIFLPGDSLSVECSEVSIKYKDAVVTIKISVTQALEGDGSADNPYLIKSMDDFVAIRNEVKKGNSFKNCHFSIVADINFSSEWTPIGCLKDGAASTGNGTNILPFAGIINGNGKKLSFAKGCKPLFNYVREASVSNFSIYAPFMDGYALVDKYTVDYGEDGDYSNGSGGSYEPGCPDTINITDVTILSGSIIKSGGFIGGFASGGNTVNMTDCLVQKDVKIGCNADGTSAENAQVGSFGGMVSGEFRNCISYADVYGTRRVGGIIGYKGQSMGLFTVEDCKFYGRIVASGDYVGGIVGSGYSSSSAPNTMCVVIQNCESTAMISGNDYVGGILGAEGAIQCWDNGIGRICNNSFSGKLQYNGNNAGGIIGYMASLNRYTIIENNYYTSSCGAKNGVGRVRYVDTSCPTHETQSDTIYFDTSKALPQISGVEHENHNREDDPLGADLEKLFRTDKSEEKYVTRLEISGDYKKTYLVGEEFDTTGMIFEATWGDGTTTTPDLSEIVFSGFSSDKASRVGITARYKNSSCIFTITVVPKSTKIKVSVSILGDSHHSNPTSNGGPHGLARGGLTTWASVSSLEADAKDTVWNVLERVMEANNLSVRQDSNNSYGSVYIRAVNGLGEFDNGQNSGWMYTVNGTHPNVGVSARYVSDGDVIVLHYTDDYNYEEGGSKYGQPVQNAEYVITLINSIGTVSYTDACKAKIDAARKAYDALSSEEQARVTNYATLTAAEKKYDELKLADDKAQAKKVDDLIGKIGTVTANSGPAITAAWNGYNGLTAAQKGYVTKLAVLQEATRKWNQLKADAVIKLIDQIVTPVTAQSKASIDAARSAYNALNKDQQALVTNLKKLTDAEAAYAQLTATDADKKKAQAVIDKIKKLGDITLDSEKDIEAARKAYDALTDLQKKLVENYDVLTAAEAKLAMLKTLGKVSDPYVTTGDYMEKLGTPSVGAVGGEWMVIGLVRSGRTVPGADTYYQGAVQYIREAIDKQTGRLHKAKSTDNSRMILALTALGKDVTNVGGYNLLQGLSDLDYVKYQGNNGPIWALLALDSGNYPAPAGSTTTRQALIDEILRVQTSDGGWAISGDKADSDMTGMALTALAPYYKKDLKVQAAIDKAVARLSEMQDADGGFSTSYGDGKMVATSESISQVVTALSALGINADTDPRFIKDGGSAIDALLRYYVSGGGFKHVMDGAIDGMGTEQAYYALTAYYRFLTGKTNLYDMTDVINRGGDPVEAEPTVPASTEPTEPEPAKTGFPWWIIVICIVGAYGLGVVTVTIIIPKFKKKG